MASSSFSREGSFQLLLNTVNEFRSFNKNCLAAILAQALRAKSYGQFDYRQLGFPKFGGFLREAERMGYVQLRQAIGGDIEVYPPGSTLPDVRTRPTQADPVAPSVTAPTAGIALPVRTVPHAGPITIRSDFWSAFVDFAPSKIRFFDKVTHRAYLLTENPNAEDSTTADARRRFNLRDQTTVLITPIGAEELVAWMREFAATQPQEVKVQLEQALARESPHSNFSFAIRSFPAMLNAWHRFRIARVEAAIRLWMDRTGVSAPEDLVTPYTIQPNRYPTRLDTRLEKTPEGPIPGEGVASMLSRMEGRIDDVIDELLRFRGAAAYIRTRTG